MSSESRPTVILVGTTDVYARIPLMRELSGSVNVSAMGTTEEQRPRFEAANLGFRTYKMGRGANPSSDIAAFKDLREQFRQLRPAIVHAFDTKPCVWARLAARAAGVPVVIGTNTGLGGLYVDLNLKKRIVRKLYEPLQRKASWQSDLTIFYNHDDAKEFTEGGIVPKDRYVVIPGSGVPVAHYRRENIDAAKVAEFRQANHFDEDTIVATLVARVYKSKGIMEYVEAAEELRQTDPNVRCVLVGGLDEEAVDALSPAEVERMRGALVWLGSHKDVRIPLAGSDLSVLPTYREGIPRALIEAAAMGLPLVATNVPGCREIVEEGLNGILIPPQNGKAIAKAIRELANSPAKREQYGAASRKKAEAEFDLGIIRDRHLEIYRQLLTQKGLAG